eukprot:m.274993 g.274993  ORF g.274993 m.274993 type:complete len:1069 (-) comp15692_c0_seq4:313-3519(-)
MGDGGAKSITRQDAEVVTRLRSGQTITSACQCIEELVLNAVDAHATTIRITVDLKAFRFSVTDNGDGMTRTDLKMIGQHHCTSKAVSLADIEHTQTYGFRGEGLASIAALSLLQITTRARQRSASAPFTHPHEPTFSAKQEGSSTPTGRQETLTKVLKGGKLVSAISDAPVAMASHGTQVVVHDLFFNLPVRRKCIDQLSEMSRIKLKVAAIALLEPSISFALIEDQTQERLLVTNGKMSPITLFGTFFGFTLSQSMESLHAKLGAYSVDGFLAQLPHHSQDLQFLFVNGRHLQRCDVHSWVSSRIGTLLFDQDDSELSPTKRDKQQGSQPRRKKGNRFLAYVLKIQCPPTAVDITTEPTKSLVAFENEERVRQLVNLALSNLLVNLGFSLTVSPDPAVDSTSIDLNATTPMTSHSITSRAPPLEPRTPPSTSRSSAKRKSGSAATITAPNLTHFSFSPRTPQPSQLRAPSRFLPCQSSSRLSVAHTQRGSAQTTPSSLPQCDRAATRDKVVHPRSPALKPTPLSSAHRVGGASNSMRSEPSSSSPSQMHSQTAKRNTTASIAAAPLQDLISSLVGDRLSKHSLFGCDDSTTEGSLRDGSVDLPHHGRRGEELADSALSFSSSAQGTLSTSCSVQAGEADGTEVEHSVWSAPASIARKGARVGPMTRTSVAPSVRDSCDCGVEALTTATTPLHRALATAGLSALIKENGKDTGQRSKEGIVQERSGCSTTPSPTHAHPILKVARAERRSKQHPVSQTEVCDEGNNDGEEVFDLDSHTSSEEKGDQEAGSQILRKPRPELEWLSKWRPEAYKSAQSDEQNEGYLQPLADLRPFGASSSAQPSSGVLELNFDKVAISMLQVLGQLDNKYILCSLNTQDAPYLIVVDQHAAHERVRLEGLEDEFVESFDDGSRKIKRNTLAQPLTITVSEYDASVAERSRSLLKQWAICFRRIDTTHLELTELPAAFIGGKRASKLRVNIETIEEYVEVLLGRCKAEKGMAWAIPFCLQDVLNTRACHGAIRFGDPLDLETCQNLVRDLSSCRLPFQCAHGRPSMIPIVALSGLLGEADHD